MKALASYVVQGQPQAVSAAFGFALLGLIIPLLGIPGFYLSSAVIGLVSLVRGPATGLLSAAITTAVLALFWQVMMGTFVTAIVLAMILWLPVWVMAAWLLRRNMSMTLLLSAALGMGMICGTFLFGDPVAELENLFQNQVLPTLQQAELSERQLQQFRDMLEIYARLATGVMLGSIITLNFTGLLIARAWQAVMYNPGGFSAEFSRLRLGSIAAWVTVAIIAVALVAPEGKLANASLNIMLVALAAFLFQGLALVQAYATTHNFGTGATVVIYVLVLITPLIFVSAVLGLVDNWFHFRRRKSSEQT